MQDKHNYDSITLNNRQYFFRCSFCFDRKAPSEKNPSVQLVLDIWDDTNSTWINHKDFQHSYLAEKITDYIKNTINGQRSIWWDKNVDRKFD